MQTYFLGKGPHLLAGLLAAVLVCIDPGLVCFSGLLVTETLAVFLILCARIATERLGEDQGWHAAILSGLAWGLANVRTREPGAPRACGPHLAGLAGRHSEASGHKKRPASHWHRRVAIIGLGHKELHQARNLGPVHHPGRRWLLWSIQRSRCQPCKTLSYGMWIDLPLSPALAREKSEVARDRDLGHIALAWIRVHPWAAARVAMMQMYHLWRPELPGKALAVLHWLLLAASAVGLVRASRAGRGSAILWGLMAGALTLASVFTLAEPRFRFVLDPALAILAAHALDLIWQSHLGARPARPSKTHGLFAGRPI